MGFEPLTSLILASTYKCQKRIFREEIHGKDSLIVWKTQISIQNLAGFNSFHSNLPTY